jgi:hypothetical protein
VPEVVMSHGHLIEHLAGRAHLRRGGRHRLVLFWRRGILGTIVSAWPC